MTATASQSRISEVFVAAKKEKRLAFMPFVTAGDPDLQTTLDVIRELAQQGVDLIEVGVPYSDPIADGPVIQASYTRALDAGFKLGAFFKALAELTQRPEIGGQRSERSASQSSTRESQLTIPPLIAMVSYSIVFRYGIERFLSEAVRAGFSGMIVPDLPGDEADEFAAVVKSHDLDLIELVSPLTPVERVDHILANCSGFVYCIAVAGTTGERAQLSPALTSQLKQLHAKTDLPLAVGFGVSRPEHVATLKGHADGVIVGSAIVRRFERFADQPREDIVREIGTYAGEMVAACRRS